MSLTLFKRELKSNYKIFLIFLAVITMYGSIIVAMYDPKLGESLKLMAESMPQVFAAFGMKNPGVTLLDFLINYLYGFILIIFPLIFIVIMSQRLVGRYIDKGSMAYLLATPHTRVEIILTQLLVLLFGVFLLIAYATILVLICSASMFQESLEIGRFLTLNLGLLGLHVFFIGVCYLTVCSFNEIKLSIGLGIGVNILFILIQMLSQVNDKIEFLKYCTPLTLFDAKGLIQYQSNALISMGTLFILAIVMMIAGTMIFKKRDLPL